MSAISISNIPISNATPNPVTSLQTYFKERHAELQQLNKALQSGDLAAAQQDYNKLVALGNDVLHKDNPFLRSDRALDFNAIGRALENGDLSGAQQAFAALQSTFEQKLPPAANPAGSPATVVSLSNTSPEIGLSSSSANGATSASESGVNIIA